MDQLLAAADTLLEVLHPSAGDTVVAEDSTYFSKSQSRGGSSKAGSRASSSRKPPPPPTKSVGSRSGAGSTVAPPSTAGSKTSRGASTVGGQSPFKVCVCFSLNVPFRLCSQEESKWIRLMIGRSAWKCGISSLLSASWLIWQR